MTEIRWALSSVALVWLGICTVFDIRDRRVPSIWWTAVPAVIAIAYRLAAGPAEPALAAALAIAASERRQMRSGWRVILTGIALSIALALLVSAGMDNNAGGGFLAVIAILFFWISWENNWLGGADAMTLIVSVLLWPSFAWLIAYLAAGSIWSIVVRIREGGWLRAHSVPGIGVVATAAVMYLAYEVWLSVG